MNSPEHSKKYTKEQASIRDELRTLNSMPDRDANALVPGHMIERPDTQAHHLMQSVFYVDVRLKPQCQRLTFTPEELQEIQKRHNQAHQADLLLSTVVDDTQHARPHPKRPKTAYRG